ncbi:MAG: site-specific DNA-methyltransferase [Thaumarchaeota archaeon]|nr:site-specific DNA-methyltransferase [Nitrososphaerota archaeon]
MRSNKNGISTYLDRAFNVDVLELLKELPDNSVDCVYADPDYNVGVKYNDVSYTKKFDDYISWCVSWAKESHRVLKENGNFFIINYPKNNAYLRTRYLDTAFCDVNEYVWIYNTNIGHSKRKFTIAHRSILHCTKSLENKFYKENVAVPYENPNDRRIKKLIKKGKPGRMPYSWIYFDLVKNVGFTKSFHACQIPEGLSKTLIGSATLPNDVVLILFGGSGSEIIECKSMKRHFISAELDKKYYALIQERLKLGGAVPEEYRMINLMKR